MMDWLNWSPFEWNLLFTCAVGLGGSVIGLFGLLIGPRRGWTVVGLLLAGLLLGASAAAAGLGLDQGLWLGLAALGGVAILFVGLRLGWLVRAAAWAARQARAPRVQGMMLVLLCPLFLVWWGLHTDQQVTIASEENFLPGFEIDPSQLHEVGTVQAVTDQGRPVPVYQVPAAAVTAEEMQRLESQTIQARELAQKQIRTSGPDESYNCHGWVFTDGHFWVRGGAVPRILEDNGYRPVSVPQPGDVIVYRDQLDAVLHTGLVRTATADGLILIESKWGWLGRYAHTPKDTCYGDRWTFYHTDRPDHRLSGLGGETFRNLALGTLH